jgi:hypothetical protein
MPYAFAPRANSTTGQVSHWDVPLSKWMGVKFDQGVHDTFFSSLSRFTEDSIYDSPEIQPELANKTFGIPGYLKFDAPVQIQRARLMRERKEAELERMAYLNGATHSTFSAKAAIGTAAGMVGAVANPLDFATMFIPFAGSSAKAARVAKMGGNRLNQLAARGLFTTESIGAVSRFPQFGAAVINGTMGNAVTEIPVFAQNVRDQAVYGPEDAALNVFLGGATGGAFHLGGVALKKILGLAADTHSRLSPEVREQAARDAVNSMLDDVAVATDRVAKTDRDAILRDLQFDEVAAREVAMVQVGVHPVEAKARAMLEALNQRQASAVDLLDMARARASTGAGTAEGTIAARLAARFQEGERSVSLFAQMAELFDVRYNPLAPTLSERTRDGLPHGDFNDTARTGAARAGKEARTEAFQVQAELKRNADALTKATDPLLQRQLRANSHLLEQRLARLTQDIQAAEAVTQRQPLSPEEISAHADELTRSGVELDDAATRTKVAEMEAFADGIQASRVQEVIDAERARHQASLEGRVDTETAARLKDEIANGKILTDEQIRDLTKNPADDGLAAIKESISTLEAELKGVPEDSPLRGLINRELKAIEETSAKDATKAYDAAVNCLLGL